MKLDLVIETTVKIMKFGSRNAGNSYYVNNATAMVLLTFVLYTVINVFLS